MLRLESYITPFLTAHLNKFIQNLTHHDLKETRKSNITTYASFGCARLSRSEGNELFIPLAYLTRIRGVLFD